MKYLINKNFIPYKYIIRREECIKKKYIKAILMLLLINVILFPIFLEKLTYKDIVEEKVEDIKRDDFNYINILISSINENIISLDIKDNKGHITLNNKEEVFSLESKKKLKIKSMINSDDNLITLGVGS